ncbi:dTDP-4-dehydrorhamnose reductase [Ensifer aridi]|uniref:dTDP-4-dehydrorhamnose reductase n=1 Tax=Ensifer aridi TaxID=1708715 RepID=UPI000A0F7688|nr:dTDP-4-dehydrorhamnose reductase [Ensifer aridi]
MRIVVTGCNGQLARSLVERSRERADTEVVTVGRPYLDLTRAETILPTIERCRPDLVISAAAYTAVDQAEAEPELALAVNATGAGAVSEAAACLELPVIHVSTDYVFDGSKEGAYVEDDPPAPLSVYGATKLAGEKAVAAANPRHLILRTAWVYSPFGKNFVKTMLRLAENREEVQVVADQWGNPSSALDIAEAVLEVAARMIQATDDSVFGVFHLVGTGVTNRADLARHVLAVSRTRGGPWALVRDVTTAEFPTPARRPANSSLSTARFSATFGCVMPAWQHSVETAVERLLRDGRR